MHQFVRVIEKIKKILELERQRKNRWRLFTLKEPKRVYLQAKYQ